MKIVILICVSAILIGTATGSRAADKACPDARSHQFDFWIGTWEVRDMGAMAGHNTIKPILDGCVLQETWQGVSNSAGSSLNFFDPSRQHWRQLWVWREGTTLELEGDFRDGVMVLEGDAKNREGKPARNRISWSVNPDGTVRQHWEISLDSGASWKTEFDGEYRRTKK